MDRELKEFIEDTVNSLSNLALLLFFYHNPGLCDTARGLSLKTDLSQEEIEKGLIGLLLLELVSNYRDRSDTLWFYTPSQKMGSLVNRLMSFYSTPQGRKEVLDILMRKDKKYEVR